jgi:hypothetical protein
VRVGGRHPDDRSRIVDAHDSANDDPSVSSSGRLPSDYISPRSLPTRRRPLLMPPLGV